MPGAVIANWPLSLIIFVVIVALVLVPKAALSTPDYVPAERVNPLDGLTVPQSSEAGRESAWPGRTPTPGDLEPASGSTGGSAPKAAQDASGIVRDREGREPPRRSDDGL